MQEAGYAAGNNNNTARLVKVAKTVGAAVDRVTELIGGGEAATALGKIAFKTTKYIAPGDSVCTGLSLLSGTCESLALCSSTIKTITFRDRIYVCSKIISKDFMTYKNACAGDGC